MTTPELLEALKAFDTPTLCNALERVVRHADGWFPMGGDPAKLAPEIARLREPFDEAEMGELYIRDRATREGWLNRPRFRKSLDKHRSTVREEFSDDDFDLMLYASHRRNRVAAQHVLRGSPGAQAGLAHVRAAAIAPWRSFIVSPRT